MATASVPQPVRHGQSASGSETFPKSGRCDTAHLKLVPAARTLRASLRQQCRQVVARLDRSHPMTRDQMEQVAREILTGAGLPEGYVGWTMVALASAFWEDHVAAVPPRRRLLLLPHCLRHSASCSADYDQYGLDCRQCGACSIADFRAEAEQMGYRVLVAEGSPVVLKIIVSGHVDAIVGVACLNVLEKAIDKVLLAGIPCMAIPLLSGNCRDTSVDEDWVHEMIRARLDPATDAPRTYVHLMRCASGLFGPDELERLVPRLRGGPRLSQVDGGDAAGLDPIAATEAIAYDFLSKGGKYSRPFITLAVYDALNGGNGTLPDGDRHVACFPDSVKRTALSIETFHKASLVHDDIEDDDSFRYGEATIHHRYGTPAAINVGDFLIGLGYRLVSREAGQLGCDAVSDILDRLADAHLRLSEGQGAELAWRDSRHQQLKPIDALRIYALKTAPAFEAALYCGVRLVGPAADYVQPIRQFARNVGVAFQILNDLKDWKSDRDNKLVSGADVLEGRPTVLLALAWDCLPEEERAELLTLTGDSTVPAPARIRRIGQLYQQADVFEKAYRLVDKHRQRARGVADQLQPTQLRRLLRYLIDTLLDRET